MILTLITTIAPISDIFSDFFDFQTIPYYCLGFLTFLIHLITDLLNKENRKKFTWYIQDFLYAIISIIIGISLCYIFDASKSIAWIVIVICGMFGSTIIRTIYSKKDNTIETAIDKITEKIVDNSADGLGQKTKEKIIGKKENENNYESL